VTALLAGLAGYLVALGVLGPRLMTVLLHRLRPSPRLALALWSALTTSWVISLISIGLAATAQLSGGMGLIALLHACLHAVLVILGTHGPAEAPAAVALAGSVLFLARLGVVAVRHARRTRQGDEGATSVRSPHTPGHEPRHHDRPRRS
jgi:hypothetical protein